MRAPARRAPLVPSAWRERQHELGLAVHVAAVEPRRSGRRRRRRAGRGAARQSRPATRAAAATALPGCMLALDFVDRGRDLDAAERRARPRSRGQEILVLVADAARRRFRKSSTTFAAADLRAGRGRCASRRAPAAALRGRGSPAAPSSGLAAAVPPTARPAWAGWYASSRRSPGCRASAAKSRCGRASP